MISLIFPRVTGKSKILWVKITIGTGDNYNIYPHVKEFGKFRIGNDDDENEMILFPGQFDFSFITNTKAEFDTIQNALRIDDAEITIRYNDEAGLIRFTGKSFRTSIDCRRITRTFSMYFYDEYKILQEDWVTPVAPAFPDSYLTIQEMVELSMQMTTINEIIITTDFLFDYDTGSGRGSFSLSEFALHKLNKFGAFRRDEDGLFYTWYSSSQKSQTLLTVLNNFASYAVIGLDRKLFIAPRFYQGGATVNINLKDTTQGSSHSTFLKKFLGMRLIFKINGNGFTIWHYGKVDLEENVEPHQVKNTEEVNSYWLQCGLNLDDESEAGRAIAVRRKDAEGNLFEVYILSASYRQADGTYSAEDGLGQHLGNILFSVTQGERSKVYAKIPGTEYNHSHFFTVDNLPTKYRPIMMEYDDMADTTDMVLLECRDVQAHAPTFTGL